MAVLKARDHTVWMFFFFVIRFWLIFTTSPRDVVPGMKTLQNEPVSESMDKKDPRPCQQLSCRTKSEHIICNMRDKSID